MRKMITALCILAVAVASMQAANTQVRKSRASDLKIESYQPAINDTDRQPTKSISGWTTSIKDAYDTHFFGFGWYLGPQKKIAYDPISGVIGSCYRQSDSEAGVDLTGTIGAMTSFTTGLNDDWKGFVETTSISRQNATAGSKFSGRYPSITADNGYLFALYNNTLGGGDGTPSATISAYSKDDESWSPRIGITDGTNTPPDAWSPVGDAVKDAQGVYHLAVTYELTLGNDDYVVITGKSATPLVPSSWTWSNYNDFKFGKTISGMTECWGTKIAWGKNGFGVVVVSGIRAIDEKCQVLYAYTTNYGQTWVKNEVANTGGLFSIPTPCDFVGKPDDLIEGSTEIFDFSIWNNFDVVVDDNNKVHIVGRVFRGSTTIGSSHANIGYRSLGGVEFLDEPVNGILHIQGDFNGTDIAWQPGKVVAEAIGGREGDRQPPETAPTEVTDVYVSGNASSVHAGVAAGNMLYIGYVDRPVDPKHITEITQVVPDAQTRTNWFADGYIIYNDGQTWHHGDAATHRGFNLTNTRDIHEQGFSVSRKGKKFGANGDQAEIFAGYQVWAPDLPQFTGMTQNDLEQWQQRYYAMQIKASSVGIETETTALDKNFALAQNYPNPFNPTTAINFNLQTAANVKLSVFNAQGQEVANLINTKMVSGAHTANFNAANLNSGVYFYKLSVDGQSAVKKMVLTK